MSLYSQRLALEQYYKKNAPEGQEPVFNYGSGGSATFVGYKEVGVALSREDALARTKAVHGETIGFNPPKGKMSEAEIARQEQQQEQIKSVVKQARQEIASSLAAKKYEIISQKEEVKKTVPMPKEFQRPDISQVDLIQAEAERQARLPTYEDYKANLYEIEYKTPIQKIKEEYFEGGKPSPSQIAIESAAKGKMKEEGYYPKGTAPPEVTAEKFRTTSEDYTGIRKEIPSDFTYNQQAQVSEVPADISKLQSQIDYETQEYQKFLEKYGSVNEEGTYELSDENYAQASYYEQSISNLQNKLTGVIEKKGYLYDEKYGGYVPISELPTETESQSYDLSFGNVIRHPIASYTAARERASDVLWQSEYSPFYANPETAQGVTKVPEKIAEASALALMASSGIGGIVGGLGTGLSYVAAGVSATNLLTGKIEKTRKELKASGLSPLQSTLISYGPDVAFAGAGLFAAIKYLTKPYYLTTPKGKMQKLPEREPEIISKGPKLILSINGDPKAEIGKFDMLVKRYPREALQTNKLRRGMETFLKTAKEGNWNVPETWIKRFEPKIIPLGKESYYVINPITGKGGMIEITEKGVSKGVILSKQGIIQEPAYIGLRRVGKNVKTTYVSDLKGFGVPTDISKLGKREKYILSQMAEKEFGRPIRESEILKMIEKGELEPSVDLLSSRRSFMKISQGKGKNAGNVNLVVKENVKPSRQEILSLAKRVPSEIEAIPIGENAILYGPEKYDYVSGAKEYKNLFKARAAGKIGSIRGKSSVYTFNIETPKETGLLPKEKPMTKTEANKLLLKNRGEITKTLRGIYGPKPESIAKLVIPKASTRAEAELLVKQNAPEIIKTLRSIYGLPSKKVGVSESKSINVMTGNAVRTPQEDITKVTAGTRSIIKSSPSEILKARQKEKEENVLKPSSKVGYNFGISPREREEEASKEAFKFAEVQKQTQKEVQVTKQAQRLIQKTSRKMMPIQTAFKKIEIIKPTNERKNYYPNKVIKTSPKKAGRKQAYQPYVRKKGKIIPIGQPTTRGRALRRGEAEALQTASATFFAKPINAFTREQEVPYSPSSAFRNYKIVNGKRVYLKDYYIQKRTQRIKSAGEKREISYMGAKARRGGFSYF